jgi:trk system potassium uptake protein TrkH
MRWPSALDSPRAPGQRSATMMDLRPVGYVIGLLVAALGATMAVPLAADLIAGNEDWTVFFEAGVVTTLFGSLLALACANARREGLTLQQTFLLTTSVWVAMPLFGSIPFLLGAPQATVTDAMFEAMSGFTTTGSTVFVGLDDMPEGILLWRSMLQWFGGIGIIVVAMAFLPELRVGGMQIFRSEAFETMGKVLPRAAEIAGRISTIYVVLTIACGFAYYAAGMTFFDSLNFALTTMSTGGFANYDASMGVYQGAPEYVASVFMVLASLPFVRYVQLVAGSARPLFLDVQVRAFLWVLGTTTLVLTLYLVVVFGDLPEHAFREALFNATSIATGTGYASVDYQLWGAFPMVVIFFVGLVGGCAGSTCCSVKIFRYQILLSAIGAQIRKIHSPHGVFLPRFDGRPVPEEVLSSVMAFFVLFTLSIGITSVLLAMTGLDLVTSITGAATALANIGPGLGPIIGPAGNFAPLNDTAKWILTFAMLIGRLELLVVLVLFTASFWRTA